MGHDPAGHLVAEDPGQALAQPPLRPVVPAEDVEVRAAQAGRLDPDEQLAGAGRRDGDLEVFRAGRRLRLDEGVHRRRDRAARACRVGGWDGDGHPVGRDLLGHDGVVDAADAADLDPDPIARLEEGRRVAEDADAGRRPGRDDVAGFERDDRADVLDELGDLPDHVGRGGVLPELRRAGFRTAAGDVPAADRELVGQRHLFAGDDDRAHRQERVRALGPEPLAVADLAVPERGLDALPVAGRDVVRDDVAGDVLVGVGRLHPACPLADDDAELRLEVEGVTARGMDDRLSVGHDGVGELGEEQRPLRAGPAALGDVVAVVQADADDLLGRLDRGGRGELADVGPGEPFGEALVVGGLDPGVPVVRGEQPVRIEQGVRLVEATHARELGRRDDVIGSDHAERALPGRRVAVTQQAHRPLLVSWGRG